MKTIAFIGKKKIIILLNGTVITATKNKKTYTLKIETPTNTINIKIPPAALAVLLTKLRPIGIVMEDEK